ncbi:MAG TPA: helix-turn-helix domain-containing protein [Thermoanaerobaculia bacterium]|jgi:DNA-binding HxlR family transcriptional regulator|nr:helix-turn-helix domain-containing protein [Thermoanaerobaculia bacterium]
MSSHKKEPAGNGARRQRANPVSGCPLTAAVAAIGGKWKLIIVYWLAESPKHFAALRKLIPGISQKVLTEQLRELIADEIVHREPKGAVPSPVEYSLTEYGQSVLPLVEIVRMWGRGHIERVRSPIQPVGRAELQR